MTDGRPRRGYVDAPHGQVHVAQAGAGTPLLLIHQTPRSWDEFREVMALLPPRIRSVAFDLPGMGASDPLPAPPSIEGYAAAALYVADQLGLDRFHVCGHHTGGVVAVELAACAPDRVRSLALSSTPWIDQTVRQARLSAPLPVDVATHRPDGGHLVELWRQRQAYYPEGHRLLDRFLADALRATSTEEGHRAVGRYKMEERAASIRCPVLVINHDNDPFASAHVETVVARFRPVTVVNVEGGRIPLEYGAPAVAQALADFVAG